MKKNTISFRKGAVKSSLSDFGTNRGVASYTVFCQYCAPTLDDRLKIANKIVKIMMEYEGKLVIHDVVNDNAKVFCEFLFEEAADYFMKDLKLEFEE